jgi:hypothetical protein
LFFLLKELNNWKSNQICQVFSIQSLILVWCKPIHWKFLKAKITTLKIIIRYLYRHLRTKDLKFMELNNFRNLKGKPIMNDFKFMGITSMSKIVKMKILGSMFIKNLLLIKNQLFMSLKNILIIKVTLNGKINSLVEMIKIPLNLIIKNRWDHFLIIA